MNILIVEDDQVLILTLQRMAQELGCNVLDIASKGTEAVVKALKYDCDLILMDIMLLDNLDGIEAYRRIRQAKNIPVIYVTGNSDQLNRDRAAEIGYHDFLTKPISLHELDTSIKRLKEKQ